MQVEMDNQQATAFELGWLAGIIDGEAWLGISVFRQFRAEGSTGQPLKAKVELKIVNTDVEIINRVDAILRKMGFNPYRRTSKPKAGRRLPMHECALKHMTALEALLPIITPHLVGIKQQRAIIMQRFIHCRRTKVGIVRPGYDSRAGARGPRHIFPYSAEELLLIESCRKLQCVGASETTRETRDSSITALARDNEQARHTWSALP